MSETLRILLIEDNESDALLMREMIDDTGLETEITWLNDGEKAMKFFDEGKKADMVLLDLNIPKVSGHEVLALLKDSDVLTNVPVVIMTGSSYPQDRERTKESGVVCYLVKPMTIKEMERTTEILKDIMLEVRRPNDLNESSPF